MILWIKRLSHFIDEIYLNYLRNDFLSQNFQSRIEMAIKKMPMMLHGDESKRKIPPMNSDQTTDSLFSSFCVVGFFRKCTLNLQQM